MFRFFADGFIVSRLKVIWKCTALSISLFDPTIDSDIKTSLSNEKIVFETNYINYYLTNLNFFSDSLFNFDDRQERKILPRERSELKIGNHFDFIFPCLY